MVEHQPFKLWVLGSSPSRLTLRQPQGLTHNLKQRLKSHQNKENTGTKEFSDLRMVYHEEFQTRKQAANRPSHLTKNVMYIAVNIMHESRTIGEFTASSIAAEVGKSITDQKEGF